MSPEEQKKVIIFDASTLISLGMNGMFEELRDLKKVFGGHFIIPSEVEYEVIGRPITIKRFELEAMKMKQLLEEGVLELPSVLGVEDSEISAGVPEIIEEANSLFEAREREVHLIDKGEAACLVLSRILDEKQIEHVIAIDERTTRMLGEKPANLKKLLQKKLKTSVEADKSRFKFFQGFKFIRSAELMFVAYKTGIIKLEGENVLDALLYAVKFKGCSISDKEITEIKRLA
jgi:hypothetical protein